MDKFYIDRQFGLPIWIDVENGIVQNCYGDTENYNARMNELYKGNTITFLKEDFIGRAMKGTYHNLVPEALSSLRQTAWAYKSKVVDVNRKIQMNLKTTPPKRENTEAWEKLNGELKLLEEQRDKFEGAQYKAERELKTEHERILNEHNYQS
ncbi:MAG TPA: hypothetical protein VMZ04_10365 [Anaerolineae bacterium]|nr:hypothetical protein [Anaerolineae bacterium]